MKQKNDFSEVICGMAQLGDIYLRAAGRVKTLYEKNPRLRFEARQLMEKMGYETPPNNLTDLVDTLLKGTTSHPVKREDRLLLYRYARKFNDPVLTQEVTMAFAGAGSDEREELIVSMKEQIAIFPDPQLGFTDLYDYGYRDIDLFPVRMEIALEILSDGHLTVWALFPDGRKQIAEDEKTIVSHGGMFGIRREEWTTYYLTAYRRGETVSFSFKESEKEYRIYQWKEDLPSLRDYSFTPYDVLTSMGVSVSVSKYNLVYEGQVTSSTTLDDIFEMFNADRPADFTGHSLSVGDVVAFFEEETWKAYYVDSFGFKKLDDFLSPEREMNAPEKAKDKKEQLREDISPAEAAKPEKPRLKRNR